MSAFFLKLETIIDIKPEVDQIVFLFDIVSEAATVLVTIFVELEVIIQWLPAKYIWLKVLLAETRKSLVKCLNS